MKELNLSEIKEIQLKILDEVASFCEKNDIKYSLSFGTLLGAVRHKGYIPWDDDIDIMMPRPDYDRFISTFQVSRNDLKVKSFLNDKNYPYPFAKVESVKSKLIEDIDITYDIGVNIDVFPIDGVPKERKFNSFFKILKIKKTILLLQIIKIDFRKRSFIKNLTLYFFKILFKMISTKLVISSINNQISKYKFFESEHVMLSCFLETKKHQKLEREIYEKFVKIEFETNKYKVIKYYDEYLKMQYGDYMCLPPVDQRQTHHTFKAYLR